MHVGLDNRRKKFPCKLFFLTNNTAADLLLKGASKSVEIDELVAMRVNASFSKRISDYKS